MLHAFQNAFKIATCASSRNKRDTYLGVANSVSLNNGSEDHLSLDLKPSCQASSWPPNKEVDTKYFLFNITP